MSENTSVKQKHLLDIIAERLGCAYLSELKQPQYRERALKELREGNFDQIDVDECREAFNYLAPPLKTMLYGTPEDGILFESWQTGEKAFAVIDLYDNYDTYSSALCSDAYEAVICMVDGAPGFEAVKAAHEHRPDTPMMWFPQSNEYTLDSFRYGCVLCCTQQQMNTEHLTWAIKNCREKLRQGRWEKRHSQPEQHCL